jgi:hypothetical protein
MDLSNAAADSMGRVGAEVAPVRVVVTAETAPPQKRPEEALVYEVQVGAFDHRDQAVAVLAQGQDWFPTA